MTRLMELEESAKRKLKGQRVWCDDCKAYKFCSQVMAFGKPSGGNVRYKLTLHNCIHTLYGTTRTFKVLTSGHENYAEIINQTSPYL